MDKRVGVLGKGFLGFGGGEGGEMHPPCLCALFCGFCVFFFLSSSLKPRASRSHT